MKLKLNRHSIFFQLVASFIAVILILFGIGYNIYFLGISIIQKQFINETSVQNKYFSDNLSAEFRRINMLQYGIVDDWDLRRLSSLSDSYSFYEKYQMTLRVRDKIITIATSSKIIDEIGIIITKTNKLISTATVNEIPTETVMKYSEYTKMSKEKIIYVNNQLMLISEYPQFYYKTNVNPDFFIYTKISKSAMKQYLNNMSNYKESNEFIFSNSNSMLISNNQNDELNKKIKELIITKKGKMIISENLRMKDTYILKEKINGEKYIIVYTDTGASDIKLVRYLSEKEAFGALENYNMVIWLFGITSLLIVVVFSKSLYNKIHNPLKKLVKAFEKLKKADLSVSIKHKSNDEFKYIYDSFNDMVVQLNTLIEEVYKGKLLVEKAKLKQLQAQINPHFLYNSFIILQNRIQLEDNEFAAKFCGELGRYFMFVTRNKQDEVPLKYEVEHAAIYANIQYARFSSRLEMKIEEFPCEFENIMVPRLILQPILENAFEHSLEKMQSGGFLHMGYDVHQDYFDIYIEDNGSEISDEEIQNLQKKLDNNEIEATGIVNINQRLKLVYSDEYGLKLSRSEYGGLKVTVRIPIENRKELENV